MDESQAVKALSALSQQTRLRILRFLMTQWPEGAPAGAIGDAVDASSSRVSFHLAALANAGLLKSERASRNVIYRVDCDAVGAMIGYLVNDCCLGHADVAACCVRA